MTDQTKPELTDEQFEDKTKAHIEDVRLRIRAVIRMLLVAQVEHDESKLVDPERDLFKRYTPKLAGCTYDSAEYKQFLSELGPALEHHYQNNRHHPEHFKEGVDGMTLFDLVEMLCDWAASSRRHNDGDIGKSIEVNTTRFGLSPQLVNVFKNTVAALGWDKEDPHAGR